MFEFYRLGKSLHRVATMRKKQRGADRVTRQPLLEPWKESVLEACASALRYSKDPEEIGIIDQAVQVVLDRHAERAKARFNKR